MPSTIIVAFDRMDVAAPIAPEWFSFNNQVEDKVRFKFVKNCWNADFQQQQQHYFILLTWHISSPGHPPFYPRYIDYFSKKGLMYTIGPPRFEVLCQTSCWQALFEDLNLLKTRVEFIHHMVHSCSAVQIPVCQVFQTQRPVSGSVTLVNLYRWLW